MKKSIGVLFLFLFFVSSVYAVADCRYSATPYHGSAPTALGWLLIWDNQRVCNWNSNCILTESGKKYNYTVGTSRGAAFVYGWGVVQSTYEICKEEIVSLPSSVCGDGIVQIPNSAGLNEECDNSSDTNCVSCKRVIPIPSTPPTSNICSDDQTIVRLFRENNSHVSDYTDSNYPVKICYSDLFGYMYSGSNPHSCNVGNTNAVFWVNATNNSHISTENTPEYSIPICYGNLDCSVKPSCDPNNEVLLLKAYEIENSHVSLTHPKYNYSICCKNSLAIRGSFWSDLSGQEITEATLGDTVLMVARGFEFEGKTLSYTLLTTSNTPVGSAISKTWNWITFRGWQETTENWVQTGINEWITDKIGSFKFRVNVEGTNLTSISFSELTVKPEGSGINEKPFVNITSSRTVYALVDTNVSFNGTVYDKEDFLTVVWDYSDTKTNTTSHYSLATAEKTYLETTHSFDLPGHYKVRLTATEEQPQRAQSNYDSVDVFVFDEGINVIPIISSPVDKKNDYGNLIRFVASESYVANCSTTAFRTGYNITINGTSMNCVYVHAPNQQTVRPGYSLDVSWLIDGVRIEQGAWGSVVPTGTIQNFLRYFQEENKHTAQFSLRFSTD